MAITLEQVRRESGATTDLYSDADINSLISTYPERAYNHFKIKVTPTDKIEYVRNYNINDIKVNEQKIMSLKSVFINGSERELNTFTFDSDISKIQTRREYDRTWVSLFPKNEPYRVKVKYSYAMLVSSGTTTESSAAITSGDSVAISVEDASSFEVGDYIRIQGFDGNNEVAKVTATDTEEITVDKLLLPHESGSVIEKLEVPKAIENYILYDICYTIANYIVGDTSNLPTSVTNEGMSATIGVAYTHWSNARDSFKVQRDKYESDIWALKTTIL